MVVEPALRRQIVLACRVLDANGHSDYIWGHVSVRDPLGRGFWMKPAGLGFDEVREADVILVDFAGSVVIGSRARHSEWPIHAEILRRQPDRNAVVHTHPPHAIAVGASDVPLRPLSHAGTLFSPPGVPRFALTADLILTADLGAALAQTLDGHPAAFLSNHGIVTAGANLPEAVVHAVLLEKACHQQLVAASTAHQLSWPSDDEAAAKRKNVWPTSHLEALWQYLVRRLPEGDA